jgi:protoheme IX farnesyltransferase
LQAPPAGSMVLVDALGAAPPLAWRDLLALGKPRLSLLVICTTGVGLRMAPGHLPFARGLVIVLATCLVVGAANALNSYMERSTDGLMRRTAQRPLPAGRVAPHVALLLALGCGTLAMVTLYWAANPLTALLSFVAFAVYAWVYTPLKRLSAWAMLVGAIPGAIPPLMGWTAVTGKLTEPGWALFALLFFWQLPHFLAVATYLQDDYARGGLKVLPLRCTPRQTVLWTSAAAVVVLPASLWPATAGIAGPVYAWGATALGVAFVFMALSGLRKVALGRWARQVFIFSIAYLTLLLLALVREAA